MTATRQWPNKKPPCQRINASILFPSSLRTSRTIRLPETLLAAGFNVICDKPMTLNLEEALKLREVVRKERKGFRPHAQLYRLPNGKGGARNGARR